MTKKSDKGNGDNGHNIFHFWDYYKQTLPPEEGGPEGVRSEDEPVEEYHLDCQGKKRLFRLQVHERGMLSFLYANEIIKGEPGGLRFMMGFNPETQVPPYYEMRKKIEERLASRSLVRDPKEKRLEVLNMLIRAQVSDSPEPGVSGPNLRVDDLEITWEDLGRILETYEGWGLRIQITEAGDE